VNRASEEDLAGNLAVAVEIADLCDAVTLPRFTSRAFDVEHKLDRSEVTEADREAERRAVERLATARPGHAVLGEEHGEQGATGSPWRWILDPIDGTSGFVRGIPVWGSLIALEHETIGLCVAVISAPALGRRWWATLGGGAFADGRRCRVSTVDTLTEAQVNLTINDGWDALGHTGALVRIGLDARRSRGVGDFWQHCLVAEGAMDVAIDAVGLAPYDIAAPRLLVTEAGGRLTDHLGRESHAGPSAISSNGILHDEILRRLGAPVPYPG
jgi:histidinol-phosphatase